MSDGTCEHGVWPKGLCGACRPPVQTVWRVAPPPRAEGIVTQAVRWKRAVDSLALLKAAIIDLQAIELSTARALWLALEETERCVDLLKPP